VTADLIVKGSVGLGSVQLDGETIYWLEHRPQEQGRYTLIRRQPDGTTEAPEESALHALRLLPDSNVLIRAPRDPAAVPEPEVYYGFLDPYTGEVRVSAADYEGILRVRVRDEEDTQSIELFEDVPGAGFFSGSAKGDDAFDPETTLFAEVLNPGGFTTTVELGKLFQEPDPQNPFIHSIDLDLNEHRLYVNVESGNPDNANSDIEWVRLFHPDLPGGFVELDLVQDRVFDYYQDENGLEKALPADFDATEDIKVVAYVSPGVYTETDVGPGDITNIQVLRSGAITMRSDWDDGPDDGVKFTSRIGRLTLDAAKGTNPYRFTSSQAFFLVNPPLHPIPGAPVDLVLRVENGALAIANLPANMYMNAQHALMGSGDQLYRMLTKGELEQADLVGDSPLAVGRLGGLQKNQVDAVFTTRGLYAKIYVQDIKESYDYFRRTKTWRLSLKFTVFE